MEEINASEYNTGVVSQIGFFYGMPCWSCAEIDPNHNQYSIVPIVSLPDGIITGIIITDHESNPLEPELVDRKNLERNFNPDSYRHQYLQMVFSFFDNLISTDSNGQVDQRENVCIFNNVQGQGMWCSCSVTLVGCNLTQSASDSGDCGTFPNETGNTGGGGTSNGGGPIIIDLGDYPNWNFGDFGSNGGGDGNGGGGNGGTNNIPDYSWDDLNFTWNDLDLSTFEAANPNDTSFPPVESSGNNTNTLDNVSQYNLFQLEQLYKAQILNFINTYQLPYQEQDLTDVGLFISCGLAGTNSAEDFFECGKYHLISSVFANLNLTGNENYYIFDHFNPLFNQVVNLVAEEGEAYASDAVKTFVDLNSIPNYEINWEDFLGYFSAEPWFDEPDPNSTIIENIEVQLECFETNNNYFGYTHKFTIFVDQPKPYTRDVVTVTPQGDWDVGHTFCMFEQISPSGEITSLVVGLYPDGEIKPVVKESKGPKYTIDDGHSYDVSVTWELSANNFNTIVEAMGEFQDLDYHLDNFNCSDFCVQAGNSILGIPDTPGVWDGGGGTNPGDLGEDLRGLTLYNNMTRNTTINSIAPSGSGCN